MRVLLLGASPETKSWQEGIKESFDYTICVDGGLELAKKWGLKVDYVVGDGDSYGGAFPKDISRENYPCEKDETDSQLAIEKALEIGAKEIVFCGFLGGRLDHTLANLALAFSAFSLNDVSCYFQEEWGFCYLADKKTKVIGGSSGDMVSLIPLFEDVRGITTEGLKYPLLNETLYWQQSRGISNELLVDKAAITKKEGRLLIVHTFRSFIKETS